MDLHQGLLALFESGDFQGKSTARIAETLNLTSPAERRALAAALYDLEEEGAIVRTGAVWRSADEEGGIVRGRLRGNERGFAFLIPESADEKDCFIPRARMKDANHGDEVLARRVRSARSDDEAEVIRVLSRGYRKLVGTYFADRTFGFVRPDERKYFRDVLVPFSASARAAQGDKVVVNITGYGDRGEPQGEIEEILGRQFSPDAEERSVLRAYEIPETFPPEVLAEAEEANMPVEKSKFAGRKDFRGDNVITIDGAESKDLDDAVSVRRVTGGYELSVHIADVSEYVRPGSALDKEALSRGTSVYFPELVVPMLPPALSNGICSLNEGEDRLTVSCVMRFDRAGNRLSSELYLGAIRSKHRMTYDKVQEILDGDRRARADYPDLMLLLGDMRDLAEALIRKRNERGGIDLDICESEIAVKDGKIAVRRHERTFAHRMIEAFMLAANEAVAEYLVEKNLPGVFRVHEKPPAEKVEAFVAFVRELGLAIAFPPDGPRPGDFQRVLTFSAGTPFESVISRVTLRSMAKADYRTENLGHFGLASPCYCHFTSPIRRYPDLMVHRAVKASLTGAPLDGIKATVAEAARQSSERERLADEAERDVDDLYKLRYMEDRVGEEAEGIVSGVTSFGVFVELPDTVEGLVRVETLPRGRYEFDDARYTLRSDRLSFRLGDRVRVRVVGVDLAARRVEFFYVGGPKSARKEGAKRRGRPPKSETRQ